MGKCNIRNGNWGKCEAKNVGTINLNFVHVFGSSKNIHVKLNTLKALDFLPPRELATYLCFGSVF